MAARASGSGEPVEVCVLLDPALEACFPLSGVFHLAKKRLKPWSLEDFDVDLAPLGSGKFGRAFRVRHKASRRICVLKTMEKQAILDENVEMQVRVRAHRMPLLCSTSSQKCVSRGYHRTDIERASPSAD